MPSKKPISEYEGKEKYSSSKSKMAHEKKESKSFEKKEGMRNPKKK